MNVLTWDILVLLMSVVVPVVLLPVCFIILGILKIKERRDAMAKTKRLYDDQDDCIGRVKFKKSNSSVDVMFNDNLKYADVTLDFDEFEIYKRRFKFKLEDERGQLEMFG